MASLLQSAVWQAERKPEISVGPARLSLLKGILFIVEDSGEGNTRIRTSLIHNINAKINVFVGINSV